MLQLVAPQDLIPNVLKLIHDVHGSAHPGKGKTVKKTNLKYFKPRMTKAVESVLVTHSCAVRKGQLASPVPMLTHGVLENHGRRSPPTP